MGKDNLFVFFATIIILMMQIGFLFLESGIVKVRSSINVAAKNLIDLCISMSIFILFGYSIMFSVWDIFSLEALDAESQAHALFNAAFCATSATIISGGIIERCKILGYIIVTIIVAGIIYPIFGNLAWFSPIEPGFYAGWLQAHGFHDFAGSTVVHSIAGWATLAVVLVIGNRISFVENKAYKIQHANNLVMTTAGTLFIFIGWIGFNCGSSFIFNANSTQVFMITVLSASIGGITVCVYNLIFKQYIDIKEVNNGMIAGLVSITAGCDVLSINAGVFVAIIGTIIGIYTANTLVKLNIDEGVGVISAHLTPGIWGTIAIPMFVPHLAGILWIQIVGVIICGILGFGVTYVITYVINIKFKFRVTAEQEQIGLNISEHKTTNEIHLLSSDLLNKHDLA